MRCAFGVYRDTGWSCVLRLTVIVPDVAQEAAVVIENHDQSARGISNVDIVRRIDGDSHRFS